jgi:NAD(P)-dependent dehydrogenase (short-subunit alcohol dehydrogenase family)
MGMTGAEEFAGKVVVITGASAGLGRAKAHAFAAAGATVAVLGTNPERTEASAAAIRAEGGRARGYLVDVSDVAAVDAVFAKIIADLGGVDVLVNNAGFAYGNIYALASIPDETLRKVFEVNVFGVIYCTRAASASMAARGGGVVINISSLSSYLPSGAYAATKAAVNSMTMSLANELAGENIRVVGIAPGMMATDRANATLSSAYAEGYRRTQLASKVGDDTDIANAALFLASDKAGFITGQTLLIDGGFLINAPKMVGK